MLMLLEKKTIHCLDGLAVVFVQVINADESFDRVRGEVQA